jgi:hypothetical protein
MTDSAYPKHILNQYLRHLYVKGALMLEPISYWCYIKVVHAWCSPKVSSFLDLNNKVAIFYEIFIIKN